MKQTIIHGNDMDLICDIEDHSIDLTILDPFLGSGVSGQVCKEINRYFIGFEIDEKLVDRYNTTQLSFL